MNGGENSKSNHTIFHDGLEDWEKGMDSSDIFYQILECKDFHIHIFESWH